MRNILSLKLQGINFKQKIQIKIVLKLMHRIYIKLNTYSSICQIISYSQIEVYNLFENQIKNIKMQDKVQFLLDRNQQFGMAQAKLLDDLTLSLRNNTAGSKEANQIWRILKEDHYFWLNAPKVMELCTLDDTKVFILVLLEDAVKQKWMALPDEQRNSLKSYVIDLILQYSGQENLQKSAQNILSKFNSILVQIVKYQWNTTWKTFINDICQSSLKSMNICENNFYILKMLSEEIFDHSKNQMTQNQIQQLKNQMNQDFTNIFQLCKIILQNLNNVKQSLMKACLQTLNAFLSWIPMYYIIYSDLIESLVLMFPNDVLRNHALSCLVEVASLQIDSNNQEEKRKYLIMLNRVTEELNNLIPLSNQDQKVKSFLNSIKKKNRNVFEILARGIANFYSQFFKNQHKWLQRAVFGNQQAIRVCNFGFRYILMMMKIDEDQVFKITIDFFHYYIGAYLQEQSKGQTTFGGSSYSKNTGLDTIYQQIFREVMKTVCLKMAKPEQVLIVIDEDGQPVRQQLENTENSSLYQIQKQLGQYLVRYNWNDMKKFILNEIEKQQQPEYFNFDTLNSLSWIVGSLCGTIQDRQERAFFIGTLRTLLQLCQYKKGKQNKAVIASCIMYVVGQYPTFLKHNWSFLKTVIKKLFQFMREQFPGIMEMACNTFLKIAKSTAEQFTMLQPNESEPFIRQIVRRISEHTKRLNHETLHYTFYQSVGYLISAENDANVQLQLMKESLGHNLFQYFNMMNMAQQNPNFLKEEDVIKKLIYFFKLNQNIAIGIGRNYAILLDILNQTMNKIYLFYSAEVTFAVNQNGKHVLNFMTVRNMRSVKKGIIKIYTRMMQKCHNLTYEQADHILNRFINPLGQLLIQFQQCSAETKQQQFVVLFSQVLEKLNIVLNTEFLSKLIQMIFTSSLPLITSDFNSFPQIRTNFFGFLKVLVKFNFSLLFSLQQDFFNTILDCIIWSFRHQLSTYSDLGLELLEQVLTNVNSNGQISNNFYCKYHMKIMTDILDVMTDGFHKSGLDSQTKIFYILVHVTTQNIVVDSISSDKPSGMSNAQFLYNFLSQRLSNAFPNVNKNLTSEKVGNWFKQTDNHKFKLQVTDYLVVINRYCPADLNQSTR